MFNMLHEDRMRTFSRYVDGLRIKRSDAAPTPFTICYSLAYVDWINVLPERSSHNISERTLNKYPDLPTPHIWSSYKLR